MQLLVHLTKLTCRKIRHLTSIIFHMTGLCPEPEEMDNAVRTVPNTQYYEGINVTYTCDQCYTGGDTSTCQCNREWSPVQKCISE